MSADSKHERAYAVLRERILEGSYGPGHRLVVDRLGRELEISGPPLREAIRRLEAEGFVEIERHVGARVPDPAPDAWEQQMELLAVLDGYATALAAPLIRAADLDAARGLNEQMRQALARMDIGAFGDLNRRFHLTLVDRCPNPQITAPVRLAWDRLSSLRMAVFTRSPVRGHQSVDEHEALLTLVEEGADHAQIEAAAREHKLRTVRAYLGQTDGGAR